MISRSVNLKVLPPKDKQTPSDFRSSTVMDSRSDSISVCLDSTSSSKVTNVSGISKLQKLGFFL
jgi:hypothetical protein